MQLSLAKLSTLKFNPSTLSPPPPRGPRWYVLVKTCVMYKFCVLLDIQAKILLGVTHCQSMNYVFCISSSIIRFLGEMLSAGLYILCFSWITSPAAQRVK